MTRLVISSLLSLSCFGVLAQANSDIWSEASHTSGIPVKILHGIALVESGKSWSDGSIRPWPWTLNSPAKGSQFFDSKDAAERGLNLLISAGVKNIDIGIMQINCRYHCSRVRVPSDLLDPYVNIRVASKILSEVHSAKGNLEDAVGAYHAGLHATNKSRLSWYQNEVARRVRHISVIGKL